MGVYRLIAGIYVSYETVIIPPGDRQRLGCTTSSAGSMIATPLYIENTHIVQGFLIAYVEEIVR